MPRIARIVCVDHPHHISQRGNNKQTVFFDIEDRKLYLKLLKKYSKECKCKIHSYCLMTNHVHLLLTPEKKESLAKAMQKISLRYTQHINKKYNRSGRLWECRFHSCVVEKETYLWSVCRYIERNPVRAGIVKDPTRYQWSSALANTTSVDRYQLITPIWETRFEREEYCRFLTQHDHRNEKEMIRKSTMGGFPIGTKQFLWRLSQDLGIVLRRRKKGRPRKSEK